MNTKGLLIGLVAISAVNGPATLRAQDSGQNSPVVVGQWTVSVYRDDGGHFMDCSAKSMAPDSRSGMDISILANGNIWLTLTNAAWAFANKTVPVNIRVDDYDLGMRSMNPIGSRSGYINFGSDKIFQAAISSGGKLYAKVGSNIKEFSLKDSDKAFGELTSCAMTGVGGPAANSVSASANTQPIAPTSMVATSPPVLLTCSLTSAATDRWLIKDNQLMAKAVESAARAGQDYASAYASMMAMQQSKMPKPTTLILELDEINRRISNRSAVSSGPLFSATEVSWQETDANGIFEFLLNRVTGGLVINKLALKGASRDLLYHGGCSVTQQRAF